MELNITPQPQRSQGAHRGGYQWQDEILFHQGDATLHTRISTLISHLVSVAGQHYRHYGKSYQRFLDEDTAYVLTRATFTIHKLPSCFQLLNINTWIDGTKGPFYQRVTQWEVAEESGDEGSENTTGEVFVQCRSDWVVMAPSSRSLVKPDKNDPLTQFQSPVALPPHQRVKINNDTTLEKRGEHKVVWSEMDANGHMYSGHYGDVIWNFLPEQFQTMTPTCFRIEFHKECCLGDTLLLSGSEISPQEYVMVGDCGDHPAFKAQISFQTNQSI